MKPETRNEYKRSNKKPSIHELICHYCKTLVVYKPIFACFEIWLIYKPILACFKILLIYIGLSTIMCLQELYTRFYESRCINATLKTLADIILTYVTNLMQLRQDCPNINKPRDGEDKLLIWNIHDLNWWHKQMIKLLELNTESV